MNRFRYFMVSTPQQYSVKTLSIRNYIITTNDLFTVSQRSPHNWWLKYMWVLTWFIFFPWWNYGKEKEVFLTIGQHVIPKSIKKMRARDSLDPGLRSCYLVSCLEINIFEVSALYNFGSGSGCRRLLVLPGIYSSSLGTFGWN